MPGAIEFLRAVRAAGYAIVIVTNNGVAEQQLKLVRCGFDVLVDAMVTSEAVSYTHLRAHETVLDLVCRLLLDNKKKTPNRKTELMRIPNKHLIYTSNKSINTLRTTNVLSNPHSLVTNQLQELTSRPHPQTVI